MDKKSPVDFRGWPAQPPEACSTPVNHGVLRAWNTAATSGGLFQFGVAPLLSSEMMVGFPLGLSGCPSCFVVQWNLTIKITLWAGPPK